MILGYHQVAKVIHIPGKIIVPLHILRDAVDDLQHGNRGLVRHPPADMDLTGSLGCIVFIGTHGAYSTTV